MGYFVLNMLSVISSLITILVAIMGFKSNGFQPLFFSLLAIILATQTCYLIFARNYIKLSKIKGSFPIPKNSESGTEYPIYFGVEFVRPPNIIITRRSFPFKAVYEVKQISNSTTMAKFTVIRYVGDEKRDLTIKWIAHGEERMD